MVNRTILVIDDTESSLFLLQKFFQKAGYLVFTAENGREGLEAALMHLPDIIVSDVVMPEMDGFELCAKIKAHPKTHAIPIILLTAKGDAASTIKGFNAGADEYISKPFDIHEVHARVERILRWVQQHKASQAKISGSLQKTPMFELIRFCEEHRISGVVHLVNDRTKETSRVHLKLGEIEQIELRTIADMTEALDELLTWEEGTFTVEQETLHLPQDEEQAAAMAETPQESPAPDETVRASAHREEFGRILAELRNQTEELEIVTLTDAGGDVLHLFAPRLSLQQQGTFGGLLTEIMRFSHQTVEALELGSLQETLLMSEEDALILYPIEHGGGLGVVTRKEYQGLVRWNCQDAIQKIHRVVR